jgi:hypothetical protein
VNYLLLKLIKAILLLAILSGCASSPPIKLDHLLFLEKARSSNKVKIANKPLNTIWSTSKPIAFSYEPDQVKLASQYLGKIGRIAHDWKKYGGKVIRVKVGKSSAKSAIGGLMIASKRSQHLEAFLLGTALRVEQRFDPRLPLNSLLIELG